MGLGIFHLLSLFLCICSYFHLSLGEEVTVTVQSVTTIATTDDPFICAALDWWPPSKCNYNMCPWGLSSIINLDLNNTVLPKAIKAFNTIRIRIGGSLQDQIVYDVGNVVDCPQFENSTTGLFGFSNGCLTMKRWDEINALFGKSGAVMTFGLNALSGRKNPANPKDIRWTGAWNPENAHDFIQYTVCKGYNVDSWEFGNELSGGGVAAKVDAVQYGQDVIALKGILTQLYQNSKIQPKLWAPGGFFESKWFSDFLQASGPNIVDQITHHIYNLGSGDDPNLFNKIQDPYVLDNIVQAYRDVEVTLQRFGPSSDASISESGGAYNSGGREISHSFVNSFWYLDQLGMASTFNHKVYCRQSLIGGNYGLLNTTTMVPNPDYYSALLFHRLMGRGVLSTLHNGSPYLRTYSHCSRQKPGITLMLINLSNSTTFDVSVVNDLNLYPPLETQVEVAPTGLREEYHLTPMDGDLMSHTMLLNGAPLKLTCSGDIPPLPPKLVDACAPITISPSSILFVTLRDFKAPACH